MTGVSGVCSLGGWVLLAEMSMKVQSPRSSGKFQKCLTARNLVLSQGFDTSEWNMALCIKYK